MNKEELQKIVEDHKAFLFCLCEHGSECKCCKNKKANLQGADLQGVNLRKANLRWADLQGANLRGADLQGADLQGANLQWANLQWADLQGANLRGADLQGVNLRGADLRGADLQGANIDFACWPLWCGSSNVKIDKRQAKQLMAHAMEAAKEFFKPTKKQKEWVNQFHRIASNEFPKID